MKSTRKLPRLRLAAGAMALAALLVACGSNASTTTSSSSAASGAGASSGASAAAGSDASTAAGSDAVATAQAMVEEYSSFDQPFPGPTDNITPGTGTAAVIAYGLLVPVLQDAANASVAALEKAGWTVTGPFDGEFSPPKLSGFIDQAVNDKVDAIIMVNTNFKDQAASLERAVAAGIQVSCVICDPVDWKASSVADKIHLATVDFEIQGEIMAYWAVANNDANVDAVITIDNGSIGTVRRAAGNQKVFDELCPDTCKTQQLTIVAADLAQPGPPPWTAWLNANPAGGSVNVAFGEADVMAIPMYKALNDVGRTDIGIIGYDADAEALQLISTPDSKYGATSGLPFEYAAWIGVDLALRAKTGAATYAADDMPIILIDKTNADQYTPYFAPAGDWQSEIAATWGK